VRDEEDAVVVSELVRSPAPAVWASIMDGDRRRRWWSYLDLEPVEGGRVVERWTTDGGQPMTTTGSVVEVVPEQRLRMTWRDDDWPAATEVEIALAAAPDGTTVTVRHRGWASLPDSAGLAEAHRVGWRAHLEALGRHVEEHR
jgi:uncharacterized protein YndB with AHSA1/START domain